MHISEVEKDPTTIGKFNQAGIGITDGEKPNNMHTGSLARVFVEAIWIYHYSTTCCDFLIKKTQHI